MNILSSVDFSAHSPLSFVFGFAVLLIPASHALSYEQATHAAITREAYIRAKINPSISDLVTRLGLQDTGMTPLGDRYVDITAGGPVIRQASPDDNPTFSNNKIRDANFSNPAFKPVLPSLPAWLMLGAIREDDVPFDQNALENTPQDEPGGPFIRVFRHFYDPYRDRGLAINLVSGTGAPDWALLPTVDSLRNHFTVTAAREATWRALTLTKVEASGTLTDIGMSTIAPQDNDQYRQDLRLMYWATTFRALGDVLHLLQDMAQPQHTRNDPHSGMGCTFAGCVGGHASYYEKYVDAKATATNQFRFRERFLLAPTTPDTIEAVAITGLSYSGYPIVSFSTYRDYFVTKTLTSSPLGSGLSNYSNQGFFTAGTNIDSNGGGFPSPPTNNNALQDQLIADGLVTDAAGSPVVGSLTVKVGTVQDNLNSSQIASGVRLSSYGAFDQFMQPTGNRQYTLNHYNYDDQARLLIPRAVAYSAGFLDYFFRGEFDISLPAAGAYSVVDHTTERCDTTCGFRKVKLKLKNLTPNETLSNGFFVAVLKFFRNKSYLEDLSGEPGGPNFTGWDARSWWEEIVVSDKIDISTLPSGHLGPNAETEISFSLAKPLPINASDIYLQVVFRGQLGNESDAVVVATKNISEPNYIAFVNDTDYKYDDATDTFQSVTPQAITNISMTLGNATTPVAALAQLGVRGYAQLAFLTDIPASGTERLTVYASHPVPGGPSFYDIPISAFDSPGAGIYQRAPANVTKYRGMWSDFRLDHFQGNIYEVALCGSGDTRRICTSAGLSPITAANAVPWTINFP